MMKRQSMVSVLALVLSLSIGAARMVDHASALEGNETQENTYGSQLMTQDERNEHRARMGAANTATERESVRKEHHAHIKERARTNNRK